MPGYYPLIKHLHILFALLSLFSFLWRGVLMWRGSSWLQHPLMRVFTKVNDTLLLIAGLLLLWLGPWLLAEAGWLQLKLLLLLLYIVMGFIALHRGSISRTQRFAVLTAAVVMFAPMVWLAHFKPF